jgi:hypothetical protein
MIPRIRIMETPPIVIEHPFVFPLPNPLPKGERERVRGMF